jgi:hypothetical protein
MYYGVFSRSFSGVSAFRVFNDFGKKLSEKRKFLSFVYGVDGEVQIQGQTAIFLDWTALFEKSLARDRSKDVLGAVAGDLIGSFVGICVKFLHLPVGGLGGASGNGEALPIFVADHLADVDDLADVVRIVG